MKQLTQIASRRQLNTTLTSAPLRRHNLTYDSLARIQKMAVEFISRNKGKKKDPCADFFTRVGH